MSGKKLDRSVWGQSWLAPFPVVLGHDLEVIHAAYVISSSCYEMAQICSKESKIEQQTSVYLPGRRNTSQHFTASQSNICLKK